MPNNKCLLTACKFPNIFTRWRNYYFLCVCVIGYQCKIVNVIHSTELIIIQCLSISKYNKHTCDSRGIKSKWKISQTSIFTIFYYAIELIAFKPRIYVPKILLHATYFFLFCHHISTFWVFTTYSIKILESFLQSSFIKFYLLTHVCILPFKTLILQW